MKNYAISYMNYHDNELIIYFAKAKNEKEAILKTIEKNTKKEDLQYIPNDYDKIIQYYYDGDTNICVKEIPNLNEIS